MNEQALIKYDIHLLEYPNWTVSDIKSQRLIIEREHGTYTLSTSLKIPSRTDCLVHYFLLSKAFDSKRKTYVEQVETTRYEIATKVLNSINPFAYKRTLESLKRWEAIHISFEGTFYKGDGYTSRGFHFIEGHKLDKKTGKLRIRFNRDYLEWLNNTEYYKLLDFDKIKKLRRPVSTRLYEVLVKTFKDREVWKIGIVKLANKLTLEKRPHAKEYYPSDVLVKVKPAINEINKRTELKIGFDYDKNSRVCQFIKLELKAEKETTKELDELLELLPIPLREQKSVRQELNKYLHKEGDEYVRSNIIYSRENATDNVKAHLKKALKGDWGEEIRAKEKEAQRLREQVEERRRIERERQRRELEEFQSEKQKSGLVQQWKAQADQALVQKVREQATQVVERDNPNIPKQFLGGLIAIKEAEIIEREHLQLSLF